MKKQWEGSMITFNLLPVSFLSLSNCQHKRQYFQKSAHVFFQEPQVTHVMK